MHLVVLGINHNTAPVELRESVTISDHELPDTLARLTQLPFIRECLLLSTCNRTEIYCTIEQLGDSDASATAQDQALVDYLASLRAISADSLQGHVYSYRDDAAAMHLMNVASGLDSMILGEYQILAQIKGAYAAAQSAASVGHHLNQLVQSALAAAKQVRTDTDIGRGIFSVGSAAVELARQIFGDTLDGRTVLIVGAGKMSDITARHLQSRGAVTIFVANRTYHRAEKLAAQLGGGAQARRFDDLAELLSTSDIVICSTAAPHPVITKSLLDGVVRSRRNRPLFLIDIAVPRDVEASVADLDDVYLFNIDDLKQVVDKASAERAKEIENAQKIISAAVSEFMAWRRSLDVAPMIVSVRRRLEALRIEELAKLRAKYPQIPEREMHAMEGAMNAYSNKVAHFATMAIKECAQIEPKQASERLDAIRCAFGLQDDAIEKGAEE